MFVDQQKPQKDDNKITGLSSNLRISNDLSNICNIREVWENGAPITLVYLKEFPQGSILAFRSKLFEEHQTSYVNLLEHLKAENALYESLQLLSNVDLNLLLFRCAAEEYATSGGKPYDIPHYGTLPYCGIASIFQLLQDIRLRNEMGHPLFDNLRQGDWLMDYIINRLMKWSSMEKLEQWMSSAFQYVRRLPRYLIPKYFDIVITRVYTTATDRIFKSMSLFITDSHDHFLQVLLHFFQAYQETLFRFPADVWDRSRCSHVIRYLCSFISCWSSSFFKWLYEMLGKRYFHRLSWPLSRHRTVSSFNFFTQKI